MSRARRAYGYCWRDAFQGFDGNDPACDIRLENMVAEIEKMELLVSEVRDGLNQLRLALRLREKMRQLRGGTTGRTDAEIDTAHRLADRLEARAVGELMKPIDVRRQSVRVPRREPAGNHLRTV